MFQHKKGWKLIEIKKECKHFNEEYPDEVTLMDQNINLILNRIAYVKDNKYYIKTS